ncbi:MAG: NAD-dependent epimerase/dehydratase family protein [Bacteroidales bacterium]|nr:NAD-dependent epimerase/dehydratase family protein [Bacteroidales bacterium]
MIFVSGGTGMVGSHLLLSLCKKQQPVVALNRPGADFSLVRKVFSLYGKDDAALFERIKWVEGDLMDYFSLETALDQVDEIYHCAALVSFQPGDKLTMLRYNVEGTANLVNAALAKGIKKFCHISSIAAIGRTDNTAPIDEQTQWKSSGRNSTYAISKYGAEREVWRGIAEGLPAVIISPSIILGPGNWNKGSAELITLVWKGLPYYTTGVNGYVDVRDVVAVMELLMEKEYFGERYIVSSENISYQQFFTWIAELLGKKPPSINVSPFMGEIAWRLFAVQGLFKRKKPAITRETARTSNRAYAYSSKKLTDTTGFRFMPVKQSLTDICTFFLEEKKQPKP